MNNLIKLLKLGSTRIALVYNIHNYLNYTKYIYSIKCIELNGVHLPKKDPKSVGKSISNLKDDTFQKNRI